MKIGLVTNKDYPNLFPDDQLLLEHLKNGGHIIEPTVWNDPLVNWSEYDLLVVRSVWDYHLHPAEFKSWMNHLSRIPVKTLNPPPVIKSNMHKSYLIKLHQIGLNVIKTMLIKKGDPCSISSITEKSDAESFVIKPAISLSAFNTFHLLRNELFQFQDKIKEMVSKYDILIQPFIPEIRTEGELSFIFFNKKFSHTIKKLPAKNDFRVQNEYGGLQTLYEAPENLISQASRFLDNVKEDLLYTRIDGIVIDDVFWLMELELIDPVLHFSLFPEALNHFSKSINDIMS